MTTILAIAAVVGKSGGTTSNIACNAQIGIVNGSIMNKYFVTVRGTPFVPIVMDGRRDIPKASVNIETVPQLKARKSEKLRGDAMKHKLQFMTCLFTMALAASVIPRISFLWSSPLSDLKVPLQTPVSKAAISEDRLYLLPLSSTSITGFSLTGQSSLHLDLADTGIVKLMGTVQDFVLDSRNTIHCVAFTMPEKESHIIRFDGATATYSLVRMSKPVYAYRVDLDAQSNYYLLGFEPSVSKQILAGNPHSGTTYLVHKFAPNGQYLGSFLPIGTPVTANEFTNWLSAISQRNSFAVLGDGEVYFYQASIDGKTPPWKEKGIVQRLNSKMSTEVVEPLPPTNRWLVGIHKFDGEIAFEWAPIQGQSSNILTRLDGQVLGTIPGGSAILAIKDGIVAAGANTKGSYNVSFVSLK
jgi:hypothetical protein